MASALGGEQIIIVLGVIEQGQKIPIDFMQSYREKAEPVADMLRRMMSRWVNLSEVLFAVDGSKGFRKAIKQVCGREALCTALYLA